MPITVIVIGISAPDRGGLDSLELIDILEKIHGPQYMVVLRGRLRQYEQQYHRENRSEPLLVAKNGRCLSGHES